MNIIKRDTGKILFQDDYYELIENLIEETNPLETIKSLLKYYKDENPSFIENIITYTRFQSWGEIEDLLREKIIIENEYRDLNELISIKYLNIDDAENARITFEQIVVKYSMRNNGLTLELVYADLYFQVLLFFIAYKAEEEEEDPFNLLSTKEKLYLLEQLIENNELKEIKSSKFLETTLSLITGIKKSSLEKPLKEYRDWFNPFPNHSITSLQSRIDSLDKIKKILETKGLRKHKLIDNIETNISTFEFEKEAKEKKMTEEKENKRNNIKNNSK